MDLTALLSTCEQLNTSIIQLSNIVNDGPDALNHVGDLAKLISLTAQTNQSQEFKYLKERLDMLVCEELTVKYDLLQFLHDLDERFKSSLKKCSVFLELGFRKLGLPILDLMALKPAEMNRKIKNIRTAYESIHYFCEDDMKLVIDTSIIINLLPELFKGLPKEVSQGIADFKKNNSAIWPNIRILEKLGKFVLPDDYLVEKQSLMAAFEKTRRKS